MTRFVTFLIFVSAALFFLTATFYWLRTRRHLLFLTEIGALTATLLLIHLLFDLSNPVVTFGPSDARLLFAAFVAVLAGIAAQYFFDLWGRPTEERQFDLPTLLKPFLISPIIFLPILGLIPEEGIEAIGKRHVFVCINAFQNGFFWRVIYEKVQRQVRS